MDKKYYTFEEVNKRTDDFIDEQAEILRANLRAAKEKNKIIDYV